MGNQQDYNLTNSQIQVLLTGTFGDGHVSKNKNGTSNYQSNCIHKEYRDYKSKLLGNLFSKNRENINQGFKQNIIYSNYSKSSNEITILHNKTLKEKLNMLDDLGLSLWFYDDGSLHKRMGFFNLNTHKFNEKDHKEILIPFFEKRLNVTPKLYWDNKKDGRKFCYLYFSRHGGAFEIQKILNKNKIFCYEYKLWSSETIHNWSKLKVELKSKDIEISKRMFANILNGTACHKKLKNLGITFSI